MRCRLQSSVLEAFADCLLTADRWCERIGEAPLRKCCTGLGGHVILVHVVHTVFRAPLHFRILTVVGVLVGVGGAFFVATGASHFGPGNIVTLAVFAAIVATLGYRQFGLAVIVRGDELVVRNYWTTHRIPSDHIRGFDRGRPSMGAGKTILVDTGMSSVPLDALVVYRQRESTLALLSDWANLG